MFKHLDFLMQSWNISLIFKQKYRVTTYFTKEITIYISRNEISQQAMSSNLQYSISLSKYQCIIKIGRIQKSYIFSPFLRIQSNTFEIHLRIKHYVSHTSLLSQMISQIKLICKSFVTILAWKTRGFRMLNNHVPLDTVGMICSHITQNALVRFDALCVCNFTNKPTGWLFVDLSKTGTGSGRGSSWTWSSCWNSGYSCWSSGIGCRRIWSRSMIVQTCNIRSGFRKLTNSLRLLILKVFLD